MQVTSEPATRGRERDRERQRETERETERKYAQDKSDRESLQVKFLLEFSDKIFYYQYLDWTVILHCTKRAKKHKIGQWRLLKSFNAIIATLLIFPRNNKTGVL